MDIIGKLPTNPGQGITSATALEPFYIGEGFTAPVLTIQCNVITNAISPKAHRVFCLFLTLPLGLFLSGPCQRRDEQVIRHISAREGSVILSRVSIDVQLTFHLNWSTGSQSDSARI